MMNPMSTSSDVAASPTLEQKKAENERRTAELRAKLIEKQKATLALQQANRATAAPPSLERQEVGLAVQHAGAPPVARAEPMLTSNEMERRDSKQDLPSDDLFSPQRMQAAGKATAQASFRKGDQVRQPPTTGNGRAEPLAARPSSNAEWQSQLGFTPDQFLNMTFDQLLNRMIEACSAVPSNNPARPYYGDLKAWLELTGYHNINLRKAKLSSYLERRELEQQAAQLQARIQKLQEEESGGISGMRITDPTPKADAITWTPRATAPHATATPFASGFKRQRSPSPSQSIKAPRTDRKLNACPSIALQQQSNRLNQPNRGRRIPSPPRFASPPRSGGSLERRISYPERRSRSPDRRNRNANDPNGQQQQRRGWNRDASLKRRQRNYGPPTNFHCDYDAYYPHYNDRRAASPNRGIGGPHFEINNQHGNHLDWRESGFYANRSKRFD